MAFLTQAFVMYIWSKIELDQPIFEPAWPNSCSLASSSKKSCKNVDEIRAAMQLCKAMLLLFCSFCFFPGWWYHRR